VSENSSSVIFFPQDELSNLMGKVKDLITENEDLHDAHKTTLIRSGTDNSEEEDDNNHIVETKVSKISGMILHQSKKRIGRETQYLKSGGCDIPERRH